MAEKEYIEREAARNIFTPPLRDPESLDFWEWLQSEIDAIPAADVRPVVRGVWMKNGWSIRCSICGYDMPFTTRNFCPNCGADMRPEPPKEERA